MRDVFAWNFPLCCKCTCYQFKEKCVPQTFPSLLCRFLITVFSDHLPCQKKKRAFEIHIPVRITNQQLSLLSLYSFKGGDCMVVC